MTNIRLQKIDPATNTDKFYDVATRFDPTTGLWVVEQRWGRNGSAGQTKTQSVSTEHKAKLVAQRIVEIRIKKGYVYVRDDVVATQQKLTDLRVAARKARRSNVQRMRDANSYGDLLFNLSRVTRAMSRLATDRYQSMSSAQQIIDLAFEQRFATEDEGRMTNELWGRLYEPTAERQEAKDDTSPARSTLHEQLDQLPEWQKLQERCRRDAAMATVCARHLAEHVVAPAIGEFPEPEPTPPPTEPGDPGSPGGSGGDQQPQGDANGQPDPAGDLSASDKARMRASLAQGLQEAHNALDQAESAMSFAWGSEAAQRGTDANPAEAMALADLLAKDRGMRELMERVGRLMRSFKAIEDNEYGGRGTTPYSITPDNDLRRLLPSERMRLAHPATKLQTMYRFMQKQTLCYDVRSKEPKAHGPFVVCMDTSSSMRDERLMAAKAFAIAAMQTATIHGRDIHLVEFNSHAFLVPVALGTPGDRVKTIRDVASVSARGGTDFVSALRVAAEYMDAKTDVLFITDGECEIGDGLEYLPEGSQLHYIHIGHGHPNNGLAREAVQVLTTDNFENMSELATMAIGAARPE